MFRTAHLRRLVLCLFSVLLASPATAQIRTRPLTLAPDAKPVTLTDILFGEETIDVTLPAKSGNTLNVTLTSKQPQAYFNVLPPGSDEAIFIGSVSGSTFTGPLPKDGTYIVRVYQMRAAARRNETADVKLSLNLLTKAPEAAALQSSKAEAKPAAATPFSYSGELHGISFSVSSPNTAEGNRVTVTPSGLAAVNDAQTVDVDGIVTGADVGDIDTDGSPEIYVYVRARQDGAPGSLVAFSANKKKSMSQIAVPELTPKQAQGYRGGDEFALVENAIARRFTLHKGDNPTGKMRQLQYKLRPGEASWVLKVDRATEF
jgi:hypothetical protein